MHIHHVFSVGQVGFGVAEFKFVAFGKTFEGGQHFAGQCVGVVAQFTCFPGFCDVDGVFLPQFVQKDYAHPALSYVVNKQNALAGNVCSLSLHNRKYAAPLS